MDLAVGMIEIASALEFESHALELGFCYDYHGLSYALPDLVRCHIHESDFQIEKCPDESL
jgi:hypothetical protein